ncbi:MAG: hypothetical protein KGH98_00915 [Candidatus Micrarchaeota archaeon]|nr:hypothetical protein [Candidatus Micrarchaeota archaeon]
MLPKIGLLAMVVLLAGIAGADTVTLTGTCPSTLINATDNVLVFNLSNSGDGIATNLVLLPTVYGAAVQNATVSLDHIFPGNSTTTRLKLYNFTMPGSYIDYFNLQYSQGSSTFYAVFPCLVYMSSRATSLVSVASINRTGDTLQATLVSLSSNPVDVNVSIVSPPEFTVSPKHVNVTVQPETPTKVYFNISNPLVSGSGFSTAVVTSYVSGGTHYSSMHTYVVSLASQATPAQSGGSTLLYFMAAIAAVILVLIALSIIRGRKPRHADNEHHAHSEAEHHHHAHAEEHRND